MYIPFKPLFSRHKGIGVQFTDDRTTDIIYHSLQSEPESECDPADLCTADPDFYRGGTEDCKEITE